MKIQSSVKAAARFGITLPAALSCGMFACGTAQGADDLLLRNAHIVDPARRVEYIGHVLVHADKVVDVLREAPVDFSGEMVDLSGKFLIPGLVDAHVHSEGNRGPQAERGEVFWVEETARRMLYCGVTAYLDVGLAPARIFPLRDRLRAGELYGADVFAAGPVFLGVAHRDPRGSTLSVETPEEVRRALAGLAQSRPDIVKIIFDWARAKNSMSLPIMRSLVETARAMNLKTMVHIGTWANARLAAEAGATSITHLNDTTVLPEDVAQLLAEKSIQFVPTLSVQQDFLNFLEQPSLLDNPLLHSVVSSELITMYRDFNPGKESDCFTCRWQREGRKHYRLSMDRLRRAGVAILAGSDTGNVGTFQGFSLHRELILLNQSGLDTWDSLAAATVRAYPLLGIKMGFERGADATFVVLAVSPVENIANTQSIERILFHGRWVDRAALAPRR